MSGPSSSPSNRLLQRMQQLNRIHGYVVAQVKAGAEADLAELQRQQSELPGTGRPLTPDEFKAGHDSRAVKIADRAADLAVVPQLIIARMVDTFQTFMDELLRLILSYQPGLLKRSEPVPMEEVLRHSTIESFRDLCRAVKTDIDFQLVKNQDEATAIERLFEVRNLITHNAGLVDKRFLARYPDPQLGLDEPYQLTPQKFADAVKLLVAVAADTERRARAKFKLPDGPL